MARPTACQGMGITIQRELKRYKVKIDVNKIEASNKQIT